MNYISLEALQYGAAMLHAMASIPPDHPARAKMRFVCEYGTDGGEAPACVNPSDYLVPDATRISSGGDIEQRPSFFCREHTGELVGEEPQEQPMFRRTEAPY